MSAGRSFGRALASLLPWMPLLAATGAAQDDMPAEPPRAVEAPVLQVQAGHARPIERASFSPDGRTLVTIEGAAPAGSGPAIVHWDVASGRVLSRETLTGAAHAAFHDDGRWLSYMALVRPPVPTDDPESENARPPVTLAYAWQGRGETFIEVDDRGRVASYDTTVSSGPDRPSPLRGSFALPSLVVDPRAAIFARGGRYLLVNTTSNGLQLWDTLRQERLLALPDVDPDESVQLAPDGSWIVCTSAQGRVRFGPVEGPWPAIDFPVGVDARDALVSDDGSTLLVPRGEGAEAWSLATGRPAQRFEERPLAVAPDGATVLLAGEDGTRAVLRATEDGRPVRTFAGSGGALTALDPSPDGRILVLGGEDGVLHLWDLDLGQETARLRMPGAVTSIDHAPDGAHLAVAADTGRGGWVHVIDAATLATTRELPGRLVEFFADGERLAVADERGVVRVWDTRSWSSRELFRFDVPARPSSLSVSQSGALLAVGFDTRVSVLVEVSTGKDLGRWPYRHVQLARQGDKALLQGGGAARSGARDAAGEPARPRPDVTLYDLATGAYGPEVAAARVRLSPDGTRLLGAGEDGFVAFRDVRDPSTELPPGGVLLPDAATLCRFSEDGSLLWIVLRDGSVMLLGVDPERDVALRLVPFSSGDWAAIDAEFRYDAANGGAVEGLHWRVGDESFALDQFKDRYFEPGLIPRTLGSGPRGWRAPEGSLAGGVEPPPSMEILEQPGGTSSTVRVRLTDQGGGCGEVAVLVNGREFVSEKPQADPPTSGAKTWTLELDLAESKQFLQGKENLIEIVPRSRGAVRGSAEVLGERPRLNGLIAVGHKFAGPRGRGGRIGRRAQANNKVASGRFFALVAGVSDYAGEEIDLLFAAKDAEFFANALELAAVDLYGDEEKVTVSLLTDGERPATRANLDDELAALRRAEPEDTVVLFLAGHGISAADEYHYILGEAGSLELPEDEAERRRAALSGAEIGDLLAELPALKVALILDTCASGALASSLAGSRGVDAARVRALQRLKDRTGTFVLAGAAADKLSYESSPLGHGLLTYSLLTAMRGARLREDAFVDVLDLFDFAKEEVPRLARDLKTRQLPEIATPRAGRAESFDIGRLDRQARASIRLAQQRPVLVRTRLERLDVPLDDLDLSASVNELFRSHAAKVETARFAFAEAEDMAGAFRVAGRYEVAGDAVRLFLYVYKGDALVRELQLEGAAADPDGIATEVLQGVAAAID